MKSLTMRIIISRKWSTINRFNSHPTHHIMIGFWNDKTKFPNQNKDDDFTSFPISLKTKKMWKKVVPGKMGLRLTMAYDSPVE